MNPKDRFAIADCEDSRAKRLLEFLIPILYPEKPTRVTVTVGNTIIGALLGERKVDWGIILQAVVAKLVEGAQKLKATPIEPYLFHLYMGQEVLNGEEMVAYEIGLDLLKYDCTPEPDPDQNQDSLTRSDPAPSTSAKYNKQKKGDRPGSSQNRGDQNKTKRRSPRRNWRRCRTPSTTRSGGWSWPKHSMTSSGTWWSMYARR